MYSLLPHTTKLVLLVIAVLLACSVQADSPPRKLGVGYPSGGVHLNTTAEFSFNDLKAYFALTRRIEVSLRYPNGTEVKVGSISDVDPSIEQAFDGVCTSSGGYDSVNYRMDQIGNWTVLWDVYYGTSPDPSKVSKESCGPRPYSVQHWRLNATVNVNSLAPAIEGDGYALAVTTTTELSSKPTGKVLASSSQHMFSAYSTLFATTLVGVAVVAV